MFKMTYVFKIIKLAACHHPHAYKLRKLIEIVQYEIVSSSWYLNVQDILLAIVQNEFNAHLF
jgi:hypothetical protein